MRINVMTTKSDASGKPLTEESCYPVIVMFDNVKYVVDLDKDNLDEEMSMLTLKQVVDLNQKRDLERNSKETLRVDLNRKVRAWAKEQGIDVKPRGMAPNKIVEQYKQAMQRKRELEAAAAKAAETAYEEMMEAGMAADREKVTEELAIEDPAETVPEKAAS